MALDNITQTIIEEARGEVNKIKKENEGKIAEIVQSFADKTKEELEKITKEEKRITKQIGDQAEFLNKIKVKNAVLDEKQKMIDLVFTGTLQELSKLDEKNKEKLFRKIFPLLPKGQTGSIKSLARDKKIISLIIKELDLNDLEISDEPLEQKGGGFIYSSDNVDIDCTFYEQLKTRRQDLIQEIAKILFNI